MVDSLTGVELPNVVNEEGRRYFVSTEGLGFSIKVLLSAGPAKHGGKFTLDGNPVGNGFVFRNCTSLLGFPENDGSYSEFTFRRSRGEEALRGNVQVASVNENIGSLKFELFRVEEHVSSYSSSFSARPSAKQVVAAPNARVDNKKFFEVSEVSGLRYCQVLCIVILINLSVVVVVVVVFFFPTAAPGRKIEVGSANRSSRTHRQKSYSIVGEAIAQRTVYYDTARNLELRGILNREQHAHLLPPPSPPRTPPRRGVKREPISDMRKDIVIDLVDDEDCIIVESTKKRQFLDVDTMYD